MSPVTLAVISSYVLYVYGLGVYRGAGALLFLNTGRCTKMEGIASGLSLLLDFLVMTNWSASKCACRVT